MICNISLYFLSHELTGVSCIVHQANNLHLLDFTDVTVTVQGETVFLNFEKS